MPAIVKKNVESEFSQEKKQKENWHRIVFNSIKTCVVIHDKTGKIVMANKAAEDVFGIPLNELQQVDVDYWNGKLYHEDNQVMDISDFPISTVFATAKPLEDVIIGLKCSLQMKIQWYALTTIPLFDDTGEVEYAVGTFQDVSRLKNTELQLKHSEQRYRELLDNMSSGVAVYQPVDDGTDFVFVDFNAAGERIDKIQKENVMNRRVTEVFPGIKEFGLLEVFQRVNKTGKSESFTKKKYQDDRFFGWRDNYVYKLPSGHLVAVYDDISNQKNAELQLKEEFAKLTSIFDNMDEVVYIADPNTYEMLYTNSVGKTFWGEDFSGKKCYEYLQNRTSPCPFCTNEKIMKHAGDSVVWEFQNAVNHRWYRCIDKSIIWIDGRLVRFELAVDINDRKHMEDELREAHKQLSLMNQELEQRVKSRTEELEQMIKLKDDFIHQLGHDLKSPLGPLVNLIPILKKHCAVDSNDKKMFTVVYRNVQYIHNLVKKTLDLARLNSPKLSLNIESVSLFDVVEDVIKSYQCFLNDSANISLTIPDNLMVSADVYLLEEILMNLLSNAVKYSPKTANIVLSADENEKFITVIIKDEGVGLSDQDLSHLFQEFYKADQSRHDLKSNGLGLVICRRIVELHGGKIWAESKGIGKGSTFYFTLPKKC